MKALFVCPLDSAWGEAIQGMRLASSLVDLGWEIDFFAPSALAPVVRRDRRIRYARIDRAMHRLDLEIAELGREVLVLVDAAVVDKAFRRQGLSQQRIVDSARSVIAIDIWNHAAGSLLWDYGAWSEPLDPIFFERGHVICPVPIAPPHAAGGYASVPAQTAPSDEARRATRRRWGVADADKLVLWPTARWQSADAHSNLALVGLAGLLPTLVLPLLDRIGAGVKVVHVGPNPVENDRPASYVHTGSLPTQEFEELLAASDALLCFNASATSLVTALRLGVPTLVCTAENYGDDPRFRALGLPPVIVGWHPPPIWAWPLSLDGIMRPVVRDNPFYDTLARADAFHGDQVIDALRALLYDEAERARVVAAQESYLRTVATLPTGAERVLAALDSTP